MPRKRQSDPIDVHVGRRIRLRRLTLGLSQEKLGEGLELTFQQMQKYESGANRVSARKLLRIARLLDCDVAFFFEDAPEIKGAAQPDVDVAFLSFVNTRESVELNRAFQAICDPRTRKSILDMIRSVARAEVPLEKSA